jgi:2-iminobutanoate/2-iminopropanoate deaminase
MTMRTIRTEAAPLPAGHYAQAIEHDGLVYVSGQLGRDPAHPDQAPLGPELETEQCLRNMANILIAAGSDLSQVLSLTVYIDDMAHWPRVNEVIAHVFGDHRPARAIVPVKTLHHGYCVEVQGIAAVAAP